MLTMMRNMLRSKFAGILFLLIIVSMAVWGTEDIFGQRAGGNLMSAGERSLTVRDIDRTLEFFLSRQRNEGGTVLSREQAVEQGVVDQLFALEASRTANLGYAASIGAVATDAAVLEEVRNTEAFKSEVTGAFDLETYRLALARADLSPTIYEQDVKDSKTLGYIGGAANSALEPPQILARIRAIQLAETRNVSWFTLDSEAVGDIAPPSDEALEAYFAENQARFRVPALRTVDTLQISADDFLHKVDIPDEDLRAIYDASKAQRFSTPERRTFTEAVAQTEDNARILFGKLAGGATLSEATDTELVSLTERTALRTELVIEELAEGLFAPTARDGTVVGPVQRDGLWIVARVNAILPGDPFPFEDVRETIFEELAASEAEGLYFNAATELDRLIGAGFTLKEIARELGVPVMRRLPISRSGITENGLAYLGLTDAPDLLEAVFELPTDVVSDPVEYRDNATLLAEVRSIAEAYTPALDTIRDEVTAAYQLNATVDAVQAYADALKARVVAGEIDFAEAAEAAGRALTVAPQSISRANYEIGLPEAAVQGVFSSNEGDVVVVPGPEQGDVTLVSVDRIIPPSEEDIRVLSAAERPRLATALQNDILASLDSEVREAVGFEADPNALEAYKASILTPQ